MKSLLLSPASLIILATLLLATFLLKGSDAKSDRPPEAAPQAAEIAPAPARMIPSPLPDTRPLSDASSAASSPQDTESRIEPDAERSRGDADLAAFEQMRSIPGAAPLIDEIVVYLQGPGSADFSMDRLPVNHEGLTELNEHSLDDLIQDEVIRNKFRALMQIIMQDAKSRS